MKKCTRCNETKKAFEFPIKREKNGKARLSSWCKPCTSSVMSYNNKKARRENPELIRARDREYYIKNKARKNAGVRERTKIFKQKCIDYLGGECKICGYNKCIAVLDFHHRDPSTKKFEISRSGLVFSDRVIRELDKCDLLCSNCHKELHYDDENKLREAV